MLLQKQFLFLKVNPTQQDLGMALLLGRRHVGSGQTAVWTFSTGNLALNTHSWCTYMVYWLPTSMPICSNGMMPTHKFAGSLPLVCRCQAMMGLDGQPAKYWKWSFFSCRKSFLCDSTEAWTPHATLHLITPVDVYVPETQRRGGGGGGAGKGEGGMYGGLGCRKEMIQGNCMDSCVRITLCCKWQWRDTQAVDVASLGCLLPVHTTIACAPVTVVYKKIWGRSQWKH